MDEDDGDDDDDDDVRMKQNTQIQRVDKIPSF
jgi:hypothetical protein